MLEIDNIPRFVYPQLTEKDRKEMSDMIGYMQEVIADLKAQVASRQKTIIVSREEAGD